VFESYDPFHSILGCTAKIAWSLRVGGLGVGSAKGLGYSVPRDETDFTVFQTIPTGCTETELSPVSLLERVTERVFITFTELATS
jgi:hypothetical protein